MNSEQKDKLFFPSFLFALFVLIIHLCWYCADMFISDSLIWSAIQALLKGSYQAGFFDSEYLTKLVIFILTIIPFIIREGTGTNASWGVVLTLVASALAVFFFPSFWLPISPMYFATTLVGFILIIMASILLNKKFFGTVNKDINNAKETFKQCERLIETDDSINIPIVYQYEHKKHHGWINVINPFRASIVLGTPGSGKSFSVYNPFIKTMIQKNYTMFLYDYKFPDLTEEVYNQFLQNQDGYKKAYGKVPQFCVLNFDDPLYSHRCNPLDPKYITDPADTAEVADLIMSNIDPHGHEKKDFFYLSAASYIDALIYFLKLHQNGRYCDFPHLIELMGRNYKAVFKMLLKYDELKIKIQPFQNALIGNAQEQLQGQIASAQIPLARFSSPAVYYVLSGNDFMLDINNPDSPKILCVGNNPDRQGIYGTTLALYTSRMFKQINHKGKIKCGVLLDELPTIFIKGLDTLIATARSNKVAIVLGAQDKSQLVRDYTEKEAEVIFNTVGNYFSGQVNGRTAKDLSDMFGREFRQQQSETTGGESVTVNKSFQQQEILPQSRIETLSQGYFFGRVADNNDNQIAEKLFCGEIQIDMDEYKKTHSKEVWKKLPPIKEKEFGLDHLEEIMRQNADDECINQLIFEFRENELDESREDPDHFNFLSDESALQVCTEQYEAKTDEEKEQLLKKAIKRRKNERVNQIVRQNYDRIKHDIEDIFKKEGIDEYGSEGQFDTDEGRSNNEYDSYDDDDEI